MGANNNSKESAYNSELEKYLEKQDKSSDDLDLDDESNFQTFNKGSSKLDEYIGFDDEEDDEEEIRYCSVCGKELKKFNYGDKCDDCVKKIELVNALNQLLDHVSPSEELKSDQLLFAGFDELQLNILISNLTEEHLIVLGSNGIFLADVKTLNNFFRAYGSSSDLLDESLYKNLMFSDNFIDISKYSDLVQVKFNPKNNKWGVTLFRDNKQVLRKFFVNIFDANNFATRYLKEMGELDNLQDRTPIKQQEVKAKYRRSKHEHVYFSQKRNQWYVKFVSHIRSKIVGFYDTEEEAVRARDSYIKTKIERQKRLKPHKHHKHESDAIIAFQERSNQWIVKVKNKRGRYTRLGYFDTEEEAIAAKNEYYGIVEEPELEDSLVFAEGDDVVTDNEDYGIAEEYGLEDSLFNDGDSVQIIDGPLKSKSGIIMRYDDERDAYLVKFDNGVSIPMLIKSDLLKLI